MGRVRLIIAILIGKMLIWLTRITGNQGTVLPGRIARIICPNILTLLGQNISEEIIVITGTNGKTTTSNMMAEILLEHNYSIVHNTAGANMITGITTAFIAKTNLWGTKIFHYALLETDEANVPLLLKEITPKVVLITNFFRDQLDRYGELDYIINLIKDAVRNTNIELVLNADDPLVAHFQRDTGLHCWYFGFNDTDYDSKDNSKNLEGKYCVFCGEKLTFRRYHYAQLGKFCCPNCQNENPTSNFVGHDLIMDPMISFCVNDIHIKSYYQGFYNAYNILAAVSLAKLIGLRDKPIIEAIKKYQPRAGRMENFFINSKQLVLILVKNPTGLNQALSALGNNLIDKNILFVLNDNVADGRDISWIWDAELEKIANPDYKVNNFLCAGQRSGDIAIRVKYTGFNEDNIIIATSLNDAIQKTIAEKSDTSYVLSTYTALFECRKILLKMQNQDKTMVDMDKHNVPSVNE
ncbi:MAG TPA: MurT ligase domain-containing protein [Syntrophomonadaceae bacterium]|nr:MurT ligase domain-containing protein [Syntrophomonadaceae bacterium]